MTGIVKILNRFFREPLINFFVVGPLFIIFALKLLQVKFFGLFHLNNIDHILTIMLTFYILPAIGIDWQSLLISVYFYSTILWIGLHLNHAANPTYRSREKSWD